MVVITKKERKKERKKFNMKYIHNFRQIFIRITKLRPMQYHYIFLL